ncbi:uncharacterized protein FOMMEDRAFT_158961 [Fomitiporia mediterranea MF3/22]|uniref:uncharacterized protein n=1 Tax=Fomitiporia mediterranea (strain MF3/22) TaxID=694068 RepID=UPI0004409837|nr:uncharacterized protein FOMMEDRAFT_158961 [Fomitiporia mediterranea MF3/22]EJD00290.1 hypothetical protein FOMMEDRAFT_158961 [Fomitiporia mediterranea MF3/22]
MATTPDYITRQIKMHSQCKSARKSGIKRAAGGKGRKDSGGDGAIRLSRSRIYVPSPRHYRLAICDSSPRPSSYLLPVESWPFRCKVLTSSPVSQTLSTRQFSDSFDPRFLPTLVSKGEISSRFPAHILLFGSPLSPAALEERSRLRVTLDSTFQVDERTAFRATHTR